MQKLYSQFLRRPLISNNGFSWRGLPPAIGVAKVRCVSIICAWERGGWESAATEVGVN